jgi:hypothetical protein
MVAAIALFFGQIPGWWKWIVAGALVVFLPTDMPEITYEKYLERWKADNSSEPEQEGQS